MTTITKVLATVCTRLGFAYRFLDRYEALMEIDFGKRSHVIFNNVLGLNTDSFQKIMRDKQATYHVLHETVAMPDTLAFVDPDPLGPFFRFAGESSLEAIGDSIEHAFDYPVIVKRNSGTMTRNVFFAKNRAKVLASLKRIYSKRQKEYDHVALVQPYIEARSEFRVVVLTGQVELVYGKRRPVKALKTFRVSLGQWNERFGRTLITDKQLLERLQAFASAVYARFPAAYMGMDVIEDQAGKLWLIELNGDPLYSGLIADQDTNVLEPLFERIVTELARRYR